MGKYLCWGSLGIAGLLFVAFILDVIIKKPFDGISTTVDVLGALCCGIVGYLAWEALRDLR